MMVMDWITEEKMPKYDDIREFEVWVHGYVRRVRRIGNRHPAFGPGTLVFVDCTHSVQNVLCDERDIKGWRHSAGDNPPVLEQVRLPAPSRLRLVATA